MIEGLINQTNNEKWIPIGKKSKRILAVINNLKNNYFTLQSLYKVLNKQTPLDDSINENTIRYNVFKLTHVGLLKRIGNAKYQIIDKQKLLETLNTGSNNSRVTPHRARNHKRNIEGVVHHFVVSKAFRRHIGYLFNKFI